MLRERSGNLYEFVTHSWNPITGACPHKCSYCYMNKMHKRFNMTPNPPCLKQSELKADLGSGNFIFVGSSIDLFANEIPSDWIEAVIHHTAKYPNNTYLWQTKNTERFLDFQYKFPYNSILCSTCETDRYYNLKDVSIKTEWPEMRSFYLSRLETEHKKWITIEPIIDFNLKGFVKLIKECAPEQVNIGADSGNNHLPEPPKEKVLALIAELEKFTNLKHQA